MKGVNVPTLGWRKSSYCQTGNNCLNVAAGPDHRIRLRESEAPDVTLTTTPRALAGFIRAAVAGRFDGLTTVR